MPNAHNLKGKGFENRPLHRKAASMILSERGFAVMEQMLDRAFGKPTQRVEDVPPSENVKFVEIEVSGMTALLARKGEEARAKLKAIK